MNINPATILSLISELYDVTEAQQVRIAELEAQVAELSKEQEDE